MECTSIKASINERGIRQTYKRIRVKEDEGRFSNAVTNKSLGKDMGITVGTIANAE